MHMRTNVRRKIETAQKKHDLITCDQPFDRQLYLHHDVSSMTEIRSFTINPDYFNFKYTKKNKLIHTWIFPNLFTKINESINLTITMRA